jgi:hypothetical protein
VNTPEVVAVLDSGALRAYARLEGLAVGELLGEIEAEDGAALLGIPVSSFLDAYRALDHDERWRLVELATSPERATVILPLREVDALEIAHLLDHHDQQTAQCLHAARSLLAQLATYDGKRLRGAIDEDLLLDLIEP